MLVTIKKVMPYCFLKFILVGDATAAGWNTNNNNQAYLQRCIKYQ